MKAGIFDLDGTLIDSMWLWENLADNYLLSIGIEPPKDLGESLKELTLEESTFYMKKRFKLKSTPCEIKRDIEKILADYYANRFQLKPYVLETLEEFKKRNIKMIIATATDEHLVSMVLDRHGIKDYFEFIQTSDNTGLSKGQPKFFQIAINSLGLDPQDIWVFEDALHCILSAKKCGLNVAAIKDKSALSDLEKIKEISDIYIDNFSQLEVEKLWKNY